MEGKGRDPLSRRADPTLEKCQRPTDGHERTDLSGINEALETAGEEMATAPSLPDSSAPLGSHDF